MQTVLLQDWLTIAGHDGIGPIAQSAHDYVDLGDHEDLVFYLQVADASGGPALSYQTSPTRQDSSFLPMIAPVTMSPGTRADRVFFATAAVPPSRYVRWSVKGGTAFSTTFRVWVCAYSF